MNSNIQNETTPDSYLQYYQSHPPNPNFNFSTPISQASAPPLSSNYSLNSDYYYPPFPQNTDQNLYHLNPASDQNQNQHSFSHQLPLHDPNQVSGNYDDLVSNYVPNSSFPSTSYYNDSILPNFDGKAEESNYGAFVGDEFSGGGVYQYKGGGKVEDYDGGRVSRVESGNGGLAFDDYGRPINVTNGMEQSEAKSYSKIVRAVPKVDDNRQDVRNGVQKFRVKILSEGGGQSDMDVLCQIGLDGIWILDPATSRILKIYQLETLTKWEVLDSYIFAFWVRSSIDVEPRRIRLKSNSYTTNNILDTVAAASIQFKEMAESTKPTKSLRESDADKKKGFDWMNFVKPGFEEKDHWVADEAVNKCTACRSDFGAFLRRHHCRNCGDIFCDKCTQGRIALTADESAQPVRVCDRCMAEVTQRLTNTEVTAKVTGLQSHDDLARKLQEAMEKSRKTSIGVMPVGSDTGMREVECPTCTVHLQVKVPSSGSETIECSVCQHPFLVSAN